MEYSLQTEADRLEVIEAIAVLSEPELEADTPRHILAGQTIIWRQVRRG
jgi:hypothetical protein